MQPIEQRIENYIVHPESGCWIWQGGKDQKGYANVFIKRKCLKVHRLAFEFRYGPIPKGMMACHTCDVPSCVNPEHVFLGTAKDNAIDACRKGRMSLRKATATVVAKLLARNTCNRGHSLSGDNLYVVKGYRNCRMCQRARNSKVNARRKKERLEQRSTMKDCVEGGK